MSTAVSNKENENEIFNELINAYKEKYGAYPLSVSQLLSHSTDTGKQLRYSFLKKAFQTWINQNQKSGKTELPMIKMEQSNENKETSKQDIDWDIVWTDYENTYSHPPMQPLHLWNHSKEMKYNAKYSQVKKLFRSLQLKRKTVANGEEGKDKEEMKKKKEMSKEELTKSVNEYFNKYKSHPKDAKMLFHYCVDELSMNVTFKAVSMAFSSFCNETSQITTSAPPPVMTRFGYFMNYDEFLSGNTTSSTAAQSQSPSVAVDVPVPVDAPVPAPIVVPVTNAPTEAVTPGVDETDVIFVSVTDGGVTKTNPISDVDVIPAIRETLQSPKKEEQNKPSAVEGEVEPGSNNGSSLKSENEKKMKREMSSELFNEIKMKYQTVFEKLPQNPIQLLHFATDNGYSVTYAAIRRAWSIVHSS